MAERYADVYARWKEDPLEFWMNAARQIEWSNQPTKAFEPNAGTYGTWFPDGVCNTCFNALDRHVLDGNGDHKALIYDSPVTGQQRTYTYSELLEEVKAFALVLEDLNVLRGDRVLIYMPMVPEALIGMLACARIGAIHSVVFGGFAPAELAARIDDAQPRVILSASCGIETNRIIQYKPMLDEALALSKSKPVCYVMLIRSPL